MTRPKRKVGRFARAWLLHCRMEVGECSDSGPRTSDETVFIDRRPPPPVDSSTDTIIGWNLDPRWLE